MDVCLCCVFKEVVKNKKKELKKVLEIDYGFLDQLVSQGTLDLEQVEDFESSILHREKIVKELVEQLKSNASHREQILKLLKTNDQHHVAAFIEHEGRLSDNARLKLLDTVRKSRITQNMKDLVEKLDPDNGLVRELVSKGCINHQQCREIEQTSPQFKRNRKLLNFMCKRSVADYDLFVDCLKICGQENLAKLLEISEEHEDVKTDGVSRNWMNELIHLIDFNHGLLDELMSRDMLELEYRVEDLKAKSSIFDQRDRLLDLMVKQSPKDITQFLNALRTTGQEHVANFITRKGCRYGSDVKLYKRWPLDSQYESRITRNFRELTELIEADVFSTELNSAACINSLQKCDVEETTTDYDKARKSLYFLLQSSIANYEDFCKRLMERNQRHVAKILENDVAVEVFDSTVRSSGAIKKQESVDRCFHRITTSVGDMSMITIILILTLNLGMGIVLVGMNVTVALVILVAIATVTYQRFRSKGAIKDQDIVDRWKVVRDNNNYKTIDEIDAVLSKRVSHGVEIVDIQPGSVRCYLLCRSQTALKTLYEKLENGSLNATLQSIFNLLLGGKNTVQLEQTKGRLSASKLQRRVKIFTKEDMWSIYDVLEPILLKVAVKLFKVNRLRLLLPRPDVTTLITVNSVCDIWWGVITGRKILRRRLKLTFKKSTALPVELFKAAVLQRHRLIDVPHKTSRDADVIVLQSLASVCRRWRPAFSESGNPRRRQFKRLFHHNPQLLFTLNQPPKESDDRPRGVRGVVMLENYYYVVYSGYNKVAVFNYIGRCKDIVVKDLKLPSDMVGSIVTSQLFIIERLSGIIFRVDLQKELSDVFVKTGYKDYAGLSLVENRLLVTSRDSLLMFDILSGEIIKKIPLTPDMNGHNVWHAIESNRDSFFVSHGPLGNSTVSEIDSEGRVIRVLANKEKEGHEKQALGNKEHFNCGYLALDSVGLLMVIDYDSRRVGLFDDCLKYIGILFDNKRLDSSRPFRLNYDKNNNRLAVGLYNGQVKMFEY